MEKPDAGHLEKEDEGKVVNEGKAVLLCNKYGFRNGYFIK